jgi:hypothetical protein
MRTPSPTPSRSKQGARLRAAPVTSVLADLGHNCPGTCTEASDELGAELWFVRRRLAAAGRRPATLVVLDVSEFHGSIERARHLMRTINDCLRSDGIRVSERRIDDSGLALAAVKPLTRRSQDRRASAPALRMIRMPS